MEWVTRSCVLFYCSKDRTQTFERVQSEFLPDFNQDSQYRAKVELQLQPKALKRSSLVSKPSPRSTEGRDIDSSSRKIPMLDTSEQPKRSLGALLSKVPTSHHFGLSSSVTVPKMNANAINNVLN